MGIDWAAQRVQTRNDSQGETENMSTIKTVGDSQPLSKSTVSTPTATRKMGTVQLVGDSQKLNRTPIASPSSNPKSGKVQQVGDSVSLNRGAVKGWGSAANLPMSDRAVAQSNTAATKGRKK